MRFAPDDPPVMSSVGRAGSSPNCRAPSARETADSLGVLGASFVF